MPRHIRILAGRLDRTAGSHVYHAQLARRLAARGHRVSVVAFEAPPDLDADAAVEAIPLVPYERLRAVWRLSSLLQYRHCTRELQRRPLDRPDVVIGGEHLFLRAHHRRFPRTPWIYLPHSLVVDQEIKSYDLAPVAHAVTTRLYVGLQRWALNHATRTMRFTHHACDALTLRYAGAIDPAFWVNAMGIDLPRRPARGPAPGIVRLLWVGQLIARKRIDVALRALCSLPTDRWRFDVVGDGQSRRELERLTVQLGLTDRVRFHGFQSDPSAWYDRADLLLFPSWLENFPVTMVESMSHGVPCLAMRGDGVRFHTANAEIIREGVDGFLAANDEEFVARLAELVGQPERLARAGAAARESVERRYTWEQHLDRYETLFAQLA